MKILYDNGMANNCVDEEVGYGNCDVSGDHWILSQRRRWSMHSLWPQTTRRTSWKLVGN